MPCQEGIDPADFAPGGKDPVDDPTTPDPEVSILDAVIVGSAGSRKAQFIVEMTNIHDVDVSVRFDTENNAAQAGTHFVGRVNQTLTISAGNSSGLIEVTILEVSNLTGNLPFFVNLSVPVDCTIDDAQGTGWIPYAAGPPPPPPDDTLPNALTGWLKPGVVYDQFTGCDYTYSCTAAACGAAMSGLFNKDHNGNADRSFDWKKLYRDAGGCLSCANSCDGESWLKMLRWMRNVGIKESTSTTLHKIQSFSEITQGNVAATIVKIKEAIRAHGIVYLSSPWYGSPNNGWNRCRSCNNFVLRNPISNAPYGKAQSDCTDWTGGNLTINPDFGHTWIFTGWNNNKANGAFEIQSSHGGDWGQGGRGWMPYSYLGVTGKWHYYKLIYGGTV